MKSYIITGVLLISFVFTNAQSHEYKAAMKAALKIHDDAKSVADEIKSLEAFEQVMKDYPNEWLAPFWAAYLCTQVARLEQRVPEEFPDNLDPKELVERANKYSRMAHDIKVDKIGDPTNEERSALHYLQGFIYYWSDRIIAATEEEKKKFKELGEKQYLRATKFYPESPLGYVNIGVTLINDFINGSSNDYTHLVTGIALLDHAKEIFDKAPERSMTTYVSKDFIGFWKNRAEKKLEGMLQNIN